MPQRLLPKKGLHKIDRATGEFIDNEIDEKVAKPKPVPDESSRNLEEISSCSR